MKDINQANVVSLVARLQVIAKKNHDEFEYNIEIETKGCKISYRFVAIETGDNHEFVSGCGDTVDDAVADAAENIEESCKDWGYKE